MSGYIDLHNHILHDIDDGPRTLKEAVRLAKDMVAAGFGTVVATPHSFEGEPSPALIKQRLNVLQAELKRQHVPLTLLPGAEQHIEPGLLERLERGEIQTLNDTSYILLELPMLQAPPIFTEQLIGRLAAHGYRPIIPHPERTIELLKKPELVERFHHAGAIYQVTWGACAGLLGGAARDFAMQLLQANLAHLFATDAHGAASRLLFLDKARLSVDNLMGEGHSEVLLSDRPQQIIADSPVALPAAKNFSETGRGKTGRGSFLRMLRRQVR